jgi:hypothetical protein
MSYVTISKRSEERAMKKLAAIGEYDNGDELRDDLHDLLKTALQVEDVLVQEGGV